MSKIYIYPQDQRIPKSRVGEQIYRGLECQTYKEIAWNSIASCLRVDVFFIVTNQYEVTLPYLNRLIL